MGSAIVIWSRKPVHQKKILLKMVKAAYESHLQFYLHGVQTYNINGITKYNPNSFTISKDVEGNIPMIIHISNFDEQQFGDEKWINTRFYSAEREEKIIPELYRLAVSEDIDNAMTFSFSYHYLKANKSHIITMADYIINWELIKRVFKGGFKEEWYPLIKKRTDNKR